MKTEFSDLDNGHSKNLGGLGTRSPVLAIRESLGLTFSNDIVLVRDCVILCLIAK